MSEPAAPSMSTQASQYARLPEKTMQRNRLMGIFEGGSARVIFNLTSGPFLVGFLKHLGASDTVCGYILAIPILAAAIQFLAPIVLERLEYRKRIIILGSELHRILLCLLIVIPFLPLPDSVRLWIAGGLYLVSNLAVSFVSPAVSNLYVSFVEPQNRGKYFGSRESYLLVFATVMNLAMGKVLDLFRDAGNERGGLVAIYATVFVLMLINTWSYLRMKEVPLGHNPDVMKIREVFTLPLKSPLFLRFFVLSILWNIGIQVSGAFYGVYQVNELAMNYTQINLYGMLSNIVYFSAAFVWGKLADKLGWAFTSMVSFLFIGFACLIWFFITKGPLMVPLLLLAMVLSGLAWSGINVSLFNLQFDFMPEEKRTVYIGFNSTVSGLLGYAASLVGSVLVGVAAGFQGSFFGLSFGIKQILFFSSGILIVFCALYVLLFMHPHTPKRKTADSR